MLPAAEFTWTVPADHPAFAGHFPGRPIVPGVVLIDRVLLFAGQLPGLADARWQIGNAKFYSPVGPGEVLTFGLQGRAGGALAFTVHSGGRDVASGSLAPATP